MRILLLSVTAGYGHTSTALALSEEFRALGAEVVVEDMYKYASQYMYTLIDKGYLYTIKLIPRGFGATYDSMERSENVRKLISILAGDRVVARKFASYFRDFRPDAIIATHVLSAHILDILKEHGELTVPVIGIVTDYCIHPGWEDLKNIDYFVTPSSLMTPAAVERGIPERKLLPLGLPVRSRFLSRLPKAEARRRLELDAGRPVVLVMGGSMGYGDMAERVRELCSSMPDAQLVCICGSNEKLYERLCALEFTEDRLRVLGFVDNVDVYMDAADCIVTKPGGLTTAELIAKRLPPVLIDPIPGQETRNMDFLVSAGAALGVPAGSPAGGAVSRLLTEPELFKSVLAGLERISHDSAAADICNFTLSLAGKTQ